jgi:hypothetical protein
MAEIIRIELPKGYRLDPQPLGYGDLVREYGDERAERISNHLRRVQDMGEPVPDFYAVEDLEKWWAANWPFPAAVYARS